MDKGASVDEIVAAVGVPVSEVRHHIMNLTKKGVGHTVEAGVVKAVYPKGRGLEDFFAAESEE
jgi:hypothetical protein